MYKIVMALLMTAATAALVAALVPACSSATPNPTGCVWALADAGLVANETCASSWSCSSNDQYFQIICTSSQGNYSCVCTSNQNTDTQTIVVPGFVCQDLTSRPVASGCGFVITD